MPLAIVVYVLTALAALVVVLTRLRLRRGVEAPTNAVIARGPVGVHTVCGVLALVVWIVFLVSGGHLAEGAVSVIGIIALVLWWVVALAGMLILLRWLPNRGKHASPGSRDSWAVGPGLSLLGHLGLVLGVIVFTYAYLVAAV